MKAPKYLAKLKAFVALILMAGCLFSCRQDKGRFHGTNSMEAAELIAIYDRGDYDEVYIVNTKGEEVAHYVLVNRNDTATYVFPEGATVIRVPLQSVVMDSEVYAGAFEELQADKSITGMLDASYVTSPGLRARLADRSIVDAGQSLSPNAEKILELQPDAVMISYYEGMQTQGLDKLGIPILKMYDLQEQSPLGRAEWLRFIGRLTGKEQEADSIFNDVKDRYMGIRTVAQTNLAKPTVLTETIYNGTWSVPGSKSYQAALIRDAGGDYFKKNDVSFGSLNLAPEQVIMEGAGSDIWIIKFYGDEAQLKGVLQSDPLYSEIKAYKENGVYFSDTSQSGLFREFPFHPDKLLQDYRLIFSGDTLLPLRYFKKLEN